MNSLRLSISLLLLSLAACAGGAPANFSSLCEDLGRTVCERESACADFGHDSLEACEEVYLYSCCFVNGQCDYRAEEGNAGIDSYAQCIDDLAAMECGETSTPASCATLAAAYVR